MKASTTRWIQCSKISLVLALHAGLTRPVGKVSGVGCWTGSVAQRSHVPFRVRLRSKTISANESSSRLLKISKFYNHAFRPRLPATPFSHAFRPRLSTTPSGHVFWPRLLATPSGHAFRPRLPACLSSRDQTVVFKFRATKCALTLFHEHFLM